MLISSLAVMSGCEPGTVSMDTAEWTLVETPDGAASFEMPKAGGQWEPSELNDADISMFSYDARFSGSKMSFTASYTDFSPQHNVSSEPIAALQKHMDELTGGQSVSQILHDMNGCPGNQFEYSKTIDGTGCRNMQLDYVDGDRLYSLSYFSYADTYDEELANRFMESLEIK